TTAVAKLVIDPNATAGARDVTVSTGTQTATLKAGFGVVVLPPVISSFGPQSGPVGTIVTIDGNNFAPAPEASMPSLNGGSISLPLQSVSTSAMSVTIPSGATT